MFDNKQLKDLSHICAYCGKALKETDKTYDHLIPKSAGGKRYTNNIVILPEQICDKPEGCERNLGVVTLKSEHSTGSVDEAVLCETGLDVVKNVIIIKQI